jgi:hypothetical protein
LLALESEVQNVFYTAPNSYLRQDLNEAYRTNQVWNRSFQIKPSQIGSMTNADHHIAFQKPGSWFPFSSEPGEGGETPDSKAIRERLAIDVRKKDAVPLRDQLHHLDSAMLGIFREQRAQTHGWEHVSANELERGLTPLQRISYLARSFFDCQFFVATQSKGFKG